MTFLLNSLSYNHSSSLAQSEDYNDLPTDRRNARSFFDQQQTKNMNRFIDTSQSIYAKTVSLLEREQKLEVELVKDDKKRNIDDKVEENQRGLEVYCLQRQKVERNKQAMDVFANKMSKRNLLSTVFRGWKSQTLRHRKANQLDNHIQQHRQKRTLKCILKSWQHLTMQSARTRIKHNVLRQTSHQLSRIQSDYSSIISSLERTLHTKLLQLSKQQSEHALLFRKYQQMILRK